MRKAKTMRAALVLLALTLITSCFVGGTFAKYVTSSDGKDSARVAKWGVSIAMSNTDETETSQLFIDEYTADNTTAAIGTYSVATNDTDENTVDVVAPGTSGKMTFSIIGTPEVDVKVNVDFGAENEYSMIKLPKTAEGTTYTDYTVSPVSTFTLADDYYPIKWTLKRAETSEGLASATAVLTDKNLDEIKDYFNDASAGLNNVYDSNTDLATKFGYFELSWKWDFGTASSFAAGAAATISANDKADTLLANIGSTNFGETAVAVEGASTVEKFKLTIIVEQID